MTTAEAEALAAELIAMAVDDLRVRDQLARDGSLFRGYHPRMQAVHDRNAARLRQILAVHGWPGQALVGREAAHAAWLILQHAIGHPDLMRWGFELLRGPLHSGVSANELAMLEDRIRSFQGEGQVYGTQFDWDEAGELSPLPIEHPETVDQRRAAVGLGPLADEVRRRRAAAVAEGEGPPPDWAGRRRDLEGWLRRVGWR